MTYGKGKDEYHNEPLLSMGPLVKKQVKKSLYYIANQPHINSNGALLCFNSLDSYWRDCN